MTTLVRGGRVVDPSTGLDGLFDILLSGGKIAAVGARLDAVPERTIDVTGLVVVPGLIDMHVHLREPGYEAKETIATGARAAARGGFTTICAMPNTNPVNDRRAVTERILAEAGRNSIVNVLPIAAVTRGSRGEDLVDMADLKASGAVAFSDDGLPVTNSRVMRQALAAAASSGGLVIDHCEDRTLAEGGSMHEGPVAAHLGLAGIPSAAEEIMIARDIILAEALKARVHIAHLSTAGGVRSVGEARRRGVRVSAEATPHHLLLTDAALESRDTNFKMNPPLRAPADVAALVEGLRTGVVDVIATDHAPHTVEEKSLGFDKAPFGIVGLETAVTLILDRFVRKRIISLGRFVELLSANPARLLGLPNRGRIAAGADADLTVLDLGLETTVDKNRFESKGRNTPFDGWTLMGGVVMTIVGGLVAYPFGDDGTTPRA
ncbi:MAG: dihydroorotase [Candidatus Aminicenantes bacterium]|nr:dihydroorotase [Candidatus Aminicenantes bacterium]